ncbi:MAG: hypothetical protein OEZ43_11295 [Gammaproteobacteria bacterium]|nr:hypothetical protein [Gammaproteobacteria bacterium]
MAVVNSNKNMLILLCLCISLSACGLGKQGPLATEEDTPAEETPFPDSYSLMVNEQNEMVLHTNQEEMPENTQHVSLPKYREPTAAKKLLMGSGAWLSMPEQQTYQTLLPQPELFCAPIDNTDYATAVEQLGGFHKTIHIGIEPDASTPRFLDGIEKPYYGIGLGGGLATASPMADGSEAAQVSIQRPNRVARFQNTGFYLSDIYGLIAVLFDDKSQIKVSCAVPLPGNAVNFLVNQDSLIVLVRSSNSRHTGLLQFKTDGQLGLTFHDALFFENTRLLDARLFNETLALYVAEEEPYDRPVISPQADFMPIYIPPVKTLNHQLKVIDTSSGLELKHTEVFALEETPPDFAGPEDSWYSNYNTFLSASGQYLIVSERKTHRYISHYETRKHSRCQEWTSREVSYRYCRTIWKQVENPDYVPPGASGTVVCTGSLLDCIKQRGPQLSRYINVADGQECRDGTYTTSSCSRYNYETYQVPIFANAEYTHFNIYRFVNGEFIKLDDQLGVLKDNELLSSNAPLQIEGHVQKHDHLKFIGDQLYAVSHANGGKSHFLNTFSVVGNSAIHVDKQLLMTTPGYASIATYFTPDKIYVSESSYQYSSTLQWSNMQLVSISNPIKPSKTGTTRVPTQFDQLFFGQDTLIGVGRVTLNDEDANFDMTLGSVTSLASDGNEIGSVLLGSDYQFYNHSVTGDDQVLELDSALNRLILPYHVQHPIANLTAAPALNRLSMIDFDMTGPKEEVTFELPAQPNRTLSIASDLAFSFSDAFIHSLTKGENWQKNAVFDGEVPASIYYSRTVEQQIQKFVRADQFVFKLVDAADGATGNILDSLSIQRASSQFCVNEQVYFDKNRILVVQEKPGVYLSYQDCETEVADRQLLLTGYRIADNKLSLIESQKELQDLYQLIGWDLQCVLDINNREGKELQEPPADMSSVSCYPRQEYDTLMNSAI